jgi:hypothetical protein
MFNKINGGQFTIKMLYIIIDTTYFTFDKELINRTCHILSIGVVRVWIGYSIHYQFKYFIYYTLISFTLFKKKIGNNHGTIFILTFFDGSFLKTLII